MLEQTLATDFRPGTNLRGDAAGASWTFLLPALEVGRVLCLGVPGAASLRTLVRVGRQLVVCCERAQERAALARTLAGSGLDAARVRVAGPEVLSRAEPVDLVVVGGRRWTRRLLRDATLRGQLARILAPNGCIYWESTRDARAHERRDGLDGRSFWLTPRLGEVGSAVPLGDVRTALYFRDHGLELSSFRRRPLQRIAAWLGGHAGLDRRARRRGAILHRAGGAPEPGPPRYLRHLAREAGLDLDGYRFGLSAPGRYSSRKVVFFLFEPGARTPRYVVKMTRDPALNARLENEARGLHALWRQRIVPDGSAPRVLFAGTHAGLAVVGETAIEGSPLRDRIRAAGSFVHGQRVVEWLRKLASGSLDVRSVGPGDVASAFAQLFERFVHVYDPEPSLRRFLAQQIERLARAPGRFPLVFQHGDPGTWNMLATPDDGIAVLDWEAAEPRSVPLWDLFYFMRSYGVSAPGGSRSRDWLERSARTFLADSPLNAFLAEAVQRACKDIDLFPQLVEPLFHVCWMHRSLKEATRLRPAALASGNFLRLLALCAERRGAAPLRRVLEP